jgi:hypothetical protein
VGTSHWTGSINQRVWINKMMKLLLFLLLMG